MPSTVSFVAVSDVANSKTFAPTNEDPGYFVVSFSLTSASSNISNNGC